MRLAVTKYTCPAGTEIEDVNYFSDVTKTIEGTIDLNDYLITDGLSSIVYTTSKVESGEFYIEAGDVRIKASNTISGYATTTDYGSLSETLLTEFFNIFTVTNLSIFKLQVYDDDNILIWTGIIRRETVKIPNRADEILNIDAVSLDKEFVEYFQNQQLPGFNQFPIANLTNVINLNGLKFTTFDAALRVIFAGVTISVNQEIGDNYFMANVAYTYSPVSMVRDYNTLHLKSGYDQFVLDFIDPVTWLKSVCLPMGWVFYFDNETLRIEKRAAVDDTAEEIDYATEVISSGQTFIKGLISAVIIDEGEYYGADSSATLDRSTAMHVVTSDEDIFQYIGGITPIVYSDIEESLFNYGRPFRYLDVASIGGNEFGYTRRFSNWNMRLQSLENFPNQFATRFVFGVEYGFNYQFRRFNYPDNNSITLRPYIVSPKYAVSVDIRNSRNNSNEFYGNGNSYTGQHNAGDNGIYMRGTAASSLIRLNPDLNKLENYQYYANSPEFAKQFKTLTGGGNMVQLNIVLHGIYTDQQTPYKIINYTYKEFDNYTFYCQELEIDLLSRTTEMKLIGIA